VEVEGRAAINKDQRGKKQGQTVIAEPQKFRREKGSRIEDEELHGKTRQPKNCDYRANGAGEFPA
jgi:hypothetical protein